MKFQKNSKKTVSKFKKSVKYQKLSKILNSQKKFSLCKVYKKFDENCKTSKNLNFKKSKNLKIKLNFQKSSKNCVQFI